MLRRWRRLLRRAGEKWSKSHDGAHVNLQQDRVTQIGTQSKFQAEPRWDRPEMDVSVIGGSLSVEEALRRQFDRPATRRDRVRFLDVSLLRSCGYAVVSTPQPENDLHASIYAPVEADTDIGDPSVEDLLMPHKLWWANPARVTLDNIAAQTSQEVEQS